VCILCFCFSYCIYVVLLSAQWGGSSGIEAQSVGSLFLQCLDTVGWVFWPIKLVPDMTYNVFGGTLNLAQFNSIQSFKYPYWKSLYNNASILFLRSTVRKPCHTGSAYNRREIIIAWAIWSNYAAVNPWERSNLSKYNLWLHWLIRKSVCASILKLALNTTPRSLAETTCSMSLTGCGIWNILASGLYNTISSLC